MSPPQSDVAEDNSKTRNPPGKPGSAEAKIDPKIDPKQKHELPPPENLSQRVLVPGDPLASTAGVSRSNPSRGAEFDHQGTFVIPAIDKLSTGSQTLGRDRLDAGAPPNQVFPKEVVLPDNQKRTFTYGEDGRLTSFTEPDGKTYTKKGDQWLGPDEKPAAFKSPTVSTRGDLSYTTNENKMVTELANGTTSVVDFNNQSTVTSDARGRVTTVQYGNSDSRKFAYDGDSTTPNKITETDGKVYTLKDGRWLGQDGSDAFKSHATVAPDGTYSYRTPDDKTICATAGGDTFSIDNDGSVTHKNSKGQITEFDFGGKKQQFGYNGLGVLNQLVLKDGTQLSMRNGQWQDASGKDSGLRDAHFLPDGSLSYRQEDTFTVESRNGQIQQFSRTAMDQAVETIKGAKDNTEWLGLSSAPQTAKIWSIMEPMSQAQRQILGEEYKSKTGNDLLADLKGRLNGPDSAHAEALMKRQDGVADTTGTISEALAKLHDARMSENRKRPMAMTDDQVRAEKEIRDAVNTLADELAAVSAKYRQDYGRDLQNDLLKNNDVSADTQTALKTYFQGKENISDNDRLQLAQTALKDGRPDIFNEVFRDASQASRDTFIQQGGLKQIESAFRGGDIQIAKDYVQRGAVSLSTIVNGDTHWYHTNSDDITRACKNATEQDRQDFMRGEDVTKNHSQNGNLAGADKRALEFYKSVVSTLHGAGNDRQEALWEAELRNKTKISTDLLQARDDGSWFGWSASTNKNQEMSAVEHLSNGDWDYLRTHPAEVTKIQNSLGTVSDSHQTEVMTRLKAKLDAPDFAASQSVGNRTLDERLADSSGLTMSDTKGRLDALNGMSLKERQDYLSNTNSYRDKINAKLHSDDERLLAGMIAQREPGEPTAAERVLTEGLLGKSPVATVNDVQAALEDPTIKGRVLNPQTKEDTQLSQYFHSAVRSAVDGAGLGDQDNGEYGTVRGKYDQYDKAIFQDGDLPLLMKKALTATQGELVDVILHASPSDRAKLLETNPDPATKQFQDSSFGGPQLKQVLTYALKQNDENGNPGALDQADRFRLFAIGGGDPASLEASLQKMNQEERQNLASQYFSKYHKLIGEDVIGKVAEPDQWRWREMLSPTDVSMRQVALDAQRNNDSHTSSWDSFLKNTWDYSRVSSDSSQDNLTKFVNDHSKEIDSLSPDLKKQWQDAVTNFQQAQNAYIESKGKFAEAFVDASLTVAAIGGAAFSGGASLALLSALGAGAGTAGAVYRVAMLKSIQGTDFDSSEANVLKQGFEGFTQAGLSFLGPEALGLKGFSVGSAVAATTASKLVTGAATSGLFKEGSQAVLESGLASLSRQGAIVGGKEITTLAKSVAADGADEKVVEKVIQQQLRQDVIAGIKSKVINEADTYIRNMAAAQVGGEGTQLLSTAAGFESPDTLWDRMKGSAVSTAAGASFFHGVFRGAQTGLAQARVLIGKTPDGQFVAGDGTVIRHGDGKTELVDTTKTKGVPYTLKPDDKIVENMSGKQSGWGHAISDSQGQVTQFKLANGEEYTRGSDGGWVDQNNHPVPIKDVSFDQDGHFQVTRDGAVRTYDDQTGNYHVDASPTVRTYYRQDGNVEAVEDRNSHERLEPQYKVAANGKQEITSLTRYHVDENGEKTVTGSMEKRRFGWTNVDAAGKETVVYGSDMTLNNDGSMTFTGRGSRLDSANEQPYIGRNLSASHEIDSVTVKLDGTSSATFENTWKKAGKGTIEYDRNNNVTQFTPPNGQAIKAEYSMNASGHSEPVKLTVGDTTYVKAAGEDKWIDQGTGKPVEGSVFMYRAGDVSVPMIGRQEKWGQVAFDSHGNVTAFRTKKGQYTSWGDAKEPWGNLVKDPGYDQNGNFHYTMPPDINYTFEKETGNFHTDKPGKPSFYFHQDGSLDAIVDTKAHTRIEAHSTAKPDGGSEITSFSRFTVDPQGNKTFIGSFDKGPKGWIKHDAGGNRVAQFGTDEIASEYTGSLTFSGAAEFTPMTVNENISTRMSQGLMTRDSSGRLVQTDASGARISYADTGEPLSVTRPDGATVNWKLGAENKIESVTTKGTNGDTEIIQRDSSGNFERVKADGTREPLELNGDRVNDVIIGRDGSVTEYNSRFEGRQVGPDGVEATIDSATGHARVSNKALKPEQQRLENMSDQLFASQPERAARFKDMMRDFEDFAQKNGISNEEIANSYHQINKMLSSNDAVLSLEERRLLAEQFLLSVAHPKTIDQGPWSTCNVTAGVQVPLAVAHPDVLAQLMTDVATTGQFVTGKGQIVDMIHTKGALNPQRDVVSTMGDGFASRSDFSDIDEHDGGSRNFFDQIIQTSLVNESWQTTGRSTASTLAQMRSGYTHQSDVLADWEANYRYGSQHYDLANDSMRGTRSQETTTKDNGKRERAPGLIDSTIVQVYRDMLGYDPPANYIVRGGGDPRSDGIARFNTEDQVRDYLLSLKNNAKPGDPKSRGLPAVVSVDSKRIQNAAGSGGYGGNHDINVHDIFQDQNGTWMVDMSNQWGTRHDRVMTLSELFSWM